MAQRRNGDLRSERVKALYTAAPKLGHAAAKGEVVPLWLARQQLRGVKSTGTHQVGRPGARA